MWESSDALHKRSWIQFADDAALITHDANGAQTLLNIATAWYSWADIKLRIEKCTTFGKRKNCGSYVQFQPVLCVDEHGLPSIEMDQSFKYLRKLFNFGMWEIEIKEQLEEQFLQHIEYEWRTGITLQDTSLHPYWWSSVIWPRKLHWRVFVNTFDEGTNWIWYMMELEREVYEIMMHFSKCISEIEQGHDHQSLVQNYSLTPNNCK